MGCAAINDVIGNADWGRHCVKRLSNTLSTTSLSIAESDWWLSREQPMLQADWSTAASCPVRREGSMAVFRPPRTRANEARKNPLLADSRKRQGRIRGGGLCSGINRDTADSFMGLFRGTLRERFSAVACLRTRSWTWEVWRGSHVGKECRSLELIFVCSEIVRR